jgi:hypothetical protein
MAPLAPLDRDLPVSAVFRQGQTSWSIFEILYRRGGSTDDPYEIPG